MLPSRESRRTAVHSSLMSLLPSLCFVGLALLLAPRGYAQSGDLVVDRVETNNRVSLTGHHPAWATAQNDVGAVPADAVLGQYGLVLARTPQQQRAFDELLKEQQDPASPNYHHWLTPTEVGRHFGASQHDLDAITNWLQSQNLHVVSIANSRMRIQFSGAASAIGNAFGAEMHYYRVDGEQRYSIAAEPQIPAALAGIIRSISGLSTVKMTPTHEMQTVTVPARSLAGNSQGNVVPDFTGSNGVHYIFPADFAKIYDVSGSFTGAGQTIAVIGRSRVNNADITNFENLAALNEETPTVIVPPNGVDPGPPETSPPVSGGVSPDQGEATLDVTRTTSVAPGATIDLVISADTSTVNGVATASEYVVDTDPVPAHIMTLSFSSCENENGLSGDDFWDSVFSQASAEGVSVFVSSGDAGAAGCDAFFTTPPVTQILSINSICASSHVTCVGGTEFADTTNPTEYWTTTNGANFETALSYIPEGGWNEPQSSSGQPETGASGGGFSVYFPTPAWQTETGVPGTQGRYTPDVAFSASGHDAYFLCLAAANGSCVVQNGSFSFQLSYGTSAAAPDMAGIAALLNQKAGGPQGELNSNLYRLAATLSNNVFHDATVASSGVTACIVTTPSMCNNSTPSPTSQTGGLSGYLVGTGYDEVTGLGSIDVGNLLANWDDGLATTTTAVVSNSSPVLVGTSVLFTATVTSSTGTPTGTVDFLDSGFAFGSGTLNGSGVATVNNTALVGGNRTITARYQGDSTHSLSVSPAITQVETFKTTTTTLTTSLTPSIGGESVTFRATVSTTQGGMPTGTVTFSDGSTTLGTGTLNAGGVATFATLPLTVGTHTITAAYSGDSNFAASTSSSLSQTVNAGKTSTTSLVPSTNPSQVGQLVTFTITLTTTQGGTPTGTVEVLDGSTEIGIVTLSSGAATFATSSLAKGSHSITAQYSGDTVFAPTTFAVVMQMVVGLTTTTALVSSLTPSPVNQAVTFTGTVTGTGGTPTGTVAFYDGTTLLFTGTVSSGVATYSTSTLAVGTHSITAVYSGDTTFAGSTSSVVTQVITTGSKATTTTLASSANPSIGQAVTFTATVSGTGGTPTGTVTFLDSGTTLGTSTLSGGAATFVASALASGTHSITASYGGDSNFAPSTSAAVSQVVNVAGFAAVSTAPTVPAGQSTVINLTLYQAAGSNLNFVLSCMSAPSKSTCTFVPPSVTPTSAGTAVQLTFGTASSGLPAGPSDRSPRPWRTLEMLAALAALLAAVMIQLRNVPRRRLAFGVCLAIVFLAAVLTGCGSSGTSTPYTGTPKGTSTFMVVGTSTTTTTTISTSVSVTVQ